MTDPAQRYAVEFFTLLRTFIRKLNVLHKGRTRTTLLCRAVFTDWKGYGEAGHRRSEREKLEQPQTTERPVRQPPSTRPSRDKDALEAERADRREALRAKKARCQRLERKPGTNHDCRGGACCHRAP